MRVRRSHVFTAVTAGVASLVLATAPQATAECIPAGGATVCAQGTITGGGPTPPTAGPYTPYPCNYDYLCQAGLSIELGPIDRPDRPNNPNRPRG